MEAIGVVEQGLPADAGVPGAPHAAVHGAEVEGRRVAGHPRHRQHPAAAMWADQAPAQRAVRARRDRLGSGRERGGECAGEGAEEQGRSDLVHAGQDAPGSEEARARGRPASAGRRARTHIQPMIPQHERLAEALADRYRLERPLGQGGMATVHLAEDLKHHRKVAIKVLRSDFGTALGAERFVREIEIAAALNHPNILAVHDSGEAAGLLYYVTPYVEGKTLRDRLQRDTRLPLQEALQIVKEVADALDYAHQRGVVHRDIKPENILFQSGHAVVADFGIARAITVAGEARGRALTQPGAVIGTPDYMSPEQASGQRELDGRCDQYALACVLYEMLVGQPPFTGPTMESVLIQHLTVAAPRITDFQPDVPKPVAAALTRALAKAPAERFSGMAAFDRRGTPCSRRCASGTRCSCWTTASIWSRRAPGWRRRCCGAARGSASWLRAARHSGSAASAPGSCRRSRSPTPGSPSLVRWQPRARRCGCSSSGPTRSGRRSS